MQRTCARGSLKRQELYAARGHFQVGHAGCASEAALQQGRACGRKGHFAFRSWARTRSTLDAPPIPPNPNLSPTPTPTQFQTLRFLSWRIPTRVSQCLSRPPSWSICSRRTGHEVQPPSGAEPRVHNETAGCSLVGVEQSFDGTRWLCGRSVWQRCFRCCKPAKQSLPLLASHRVHHLRSHVA